MNKKDKVMKKAVLVLSIFLCVFFVTSVDAATYVVTKTADTNDGACNADCSLREALIAVNNNIPGGATHRIEFSSLFDAPQTLETTQFFLDYNTRVEIIGRGNLTTTITTASGSLNGAFQINSAYCKITNLRFADCNNELDGGAIFGNDGGDLIIERCLFENNFGYSGGALDLRAFTSVTIRDSTFRDNQAYGLFGEGGAVFLENYSQVIARSTFSGNQSPNGSVAYFSGYVSATTGEITNSTFAGNNASNGSIIRNTSGIMDLRNVTVADNTASATAIDTFNTVTTQIRLTNSIVAGNSSGNVSGRVTLIAPNITGGSPMLGALAFNGGETQTMALLAGSPAIDAGSSVNAPPTDQRGIARPQGAGFDLGSFEKESGPLPLQIVTGSNLPSGMVGQAYALQIVAADGTPPYTFALTGGVLPNGIANSNAGLLSGTPTQFGMFSFTVTATDSVSATAQKTFQLTIQPPPLQIVTSAALPNATQNQSYSRQLLADGGAPPYTFSQNGGTLPNGISLSSGGLLSGTPTQFGSFSFEITVMDTLGASAQRTFFLTTYPALTILTKRNLPTGITNQSYSVQIYADGGFAPYTFSLDSGTLPNGFSLSPTGVLNGITTQPETSDFGIRVMDALGNQVQKTFRLTISNLYIVTTNADTNDGVCDADCSLREAVAVGDSIPGSSNVIEFSPFFDQLQTIPLSSPISITKTTEIRGKGVNKTTVSSVNFRDAKFNISGTGDVTFRNLMIGHTISGVQSSAIDNQSSGQLTIDTCVFRDNSIIVTPQRSDGGAILQTSGSLIVNNSTFRSNGILFNNTICGGKGGAIAFSGGAASITSSTFVGNIAPNGTAIYGNGSVSIENSTFSGNGPRWDGCVAPAYGTILNESGGIAITNSTIYRNTNFDISGSALTGNISILNSIVAENTRDVIGPITSPNIGAGVVSAGNNLIGFAPALTPGLPNANYDYAGTGAAPLDPLLNALTANGGETETHAPQGASLAINNGDAANAPATDQRGVVRPQGVGVDIGAFETDVPITSAATQAGSNVAISLDTVSVTFSNVTDAGTTTQIPIHPAISGSLPGGFSFGTGLPAFQITTTAQYAAPITICIQVSNITNLTAFNQLRLFHSENGVLVDRTSSRDFPTRTICGVTTSLSPFAIAESLAPTAANVSVSGQVLTASGQGIRGVGVTLTDSTGVTQSATTSSFGYYRFDDVEVGQTYIVSVRSKRFQFSNPTQVITLMDELSDLTFTALPE